MTAVASRPLLRSMITVHATAHPEFDVILTPAALSFVGDLADRSTGPWVGGSPLRDHRPPDTGDDRQRLELGGATATIMVRPRGLHMCEKHLRLDGQAIPGAFVDFGLFLFHNAHALINSGRGPYFYLPKLQSHLEARLWNDIFTWSEQVLVLQPGTIRATCLLETFPAAFEMEEILYELREHSAGLNAGRWDYLFSYLKTFADDPAKVLPERGAVTMTVPMMQAYCQQLVRVCHARGAHAIGGIAAFVPDRSSAEITTTADLVGETVPGDITPRGVRNNIEVSLRYLTAWVGGRGAVTINHLMEDAGNQPSRRLHRLRLQLPNRVVS